MPDDDGDGREVLEHWIAAIVSVLIVLAAVAALTRCGWMPAGW